MMTSLENDPTVPPEATPAAPSPVADEPADPAFDAVESLLRLIIGGSIEAPAELVERLKKWEQLAQEEDTAVSLAQANLPDDLRYALVGLAFEAQDQLRGGLSRFGRLINSSSRLFLRAARPVTNSRPMQPVHSRYEKLVRRGETAVDRWVARGQAEEPRSRLLAREALGRTIDEVIDHLAENPEVRDLVTQQSVGIAGEVVGGVRTRTVTADTMLERLVRGLLNRPPREQLPPPADEIIAQGTSVTDLLNEDRQ